MRCIVVMALCAGEVRAKTRPMRTCTCMCTLHRQCLKSLLGWMLVCVRCKPPLMPLPCIRRVCIARFGAVCGCVLFLQADAAQLCMRLQFCQLSAARAAVLYAAAACVDACAFISACLSPCLDLNSHMQLLPIYVHVHDFIARAQPACTALDRAPRIHAAFYSLARCCWCASSRHHQASVFVVGSVYVHLLRAAARPFRRHGPWRILLLLCVPVSCSALFPHACVAAVQPGAAAASAGT